MIEMTVDKQSLEAALAAIGNVGPSARFAASIGINRTLNEAQDAIRAGLGGRFTLRREAFIKSTIYRKPGEDFASKTTLSGGVRVNPARDVLAKFEEGGTKRPQSGKALAIPINVKRNASDIVTRANSVRAILASGKAFIKNGRVWQRIGRGKRATLRLAYVFKPSVSIAPRLEFVETGTKVINERIVDNIAGAIQVELERGLVTRNPAAS